MKKILKNKSFQADCSIGHTFRAHHHGPPDNLITNMTRSFLRQSYFRAHICKDVDFLVEICDSA